MDTRPLSAVTLWLCALQNQYTTRGHFLHFLFRFILQGLPDETGRIQILNIHTARMRENKLLASDVDVKELAVETKNYSGAELEGLVRAAQSTAMNRHIKVSPRSLFTVHLLMCMFFGL